MRSKIFILSILSCFLLSSCAIHDNFPYICFLKKCVESQKMDRHAKRKAKKGGLAGKKLTRKHKQEKTEVKKEKKDFVK